MRSENALTKPDTSYRKTFVLKQETPMIHFQHRDSGVVIRASELKPKFDKFMLNKMKNDTSGKEEWLLKQTDKDKTPAFNYKVRIYANGKPEKSQTIERDIKKNRNPQEKKEIDKDYADKAINSMYFGNMVDKKNNSNYEADVKRAYKETIFYTSEIYVEILCFNESLLKYIEDNIEEFLLVTNFGTRQSKGFGCFSLKKNNDPLKILTDNKYDYIYCKIENSSNTNNKTDRFSNANNKIDKSSKALNIAAGIYAVMKGGVNGHRKDDKYEDDKYIKGYIQRAYLDDNKKDKVGSDKAFIKAKVLPATPRQIEIKSDNFKKYADYEYVRAILGIPEFIEFREGKVTIKNKNSSDDKIERFRSPIQIVVSGNYVILIMNDSYNDILGKKFSFGENENNTIKVPSEFDPQKFLSDFVKYFNSERSKLANVYYRDASKVVLKKGGES